MLTPTTERAPRNVQYFVSTRADKEVADDLIAWLAGSHIADVVGQPGFKHGELLRVDSRSDDGKVGVLTMYLIESLADLEAYFVSEAKTRFDREASQFAGKLTVERWWGESVFAIGAATASR